MSTKSIAPSIQRLVDYLYEEERKHYQAAPSRDHIYHDVLRVKNWLRDRYEDVPTSAAKIKLEPQSIRRRSA